MNLRTVFTTRINGRIRRIFCILCTVLTGSSTCLTNPLNRIVLLVNKVGTNDVLHLKVLKFVVPDSLDYPCLSNVITEAGNTERAVLMVIIVISNLGRRVLWFGNKGRGRYTIHIVRIIIDLSITSLSFSMFV